MLFQLQRNFILCAALLLLLLHCKAAAEDDTTPANSEEEDDSSSEETVEDSNESRRKRSLEASADADNANKAVGGGAARVGIPGVPALPDPATILKIAEIVQTVGEKVIPILVEGNPTAGLVAERLNKNLEFLKNFKQEIDTFTDELRLNIWLS